MWLRKKKAVPSMESLIQYLESMLAAATGSCTQCLIDDLGNETFELGTAIARFEVAHAWRHMTPDGQEQLTDAFGEFLMRVIKIAVFTGELTHRPGVRWADTTIEITNPKVCPN